MEFKHTLEIVTKDIQDIEKLVSNFKNYSSVPSIELDLALSKLRNVYDVLLMFRETPDSVSPVTKQSETLSSEKTHIISEKKQPFTAKDKAPAEPVEKDSKAKHILESAESPEEDIFEVDDILPPEKKISHSKKSVAKTQGILAEKFATDKTFIHEKLGKQIHKTDISAIHESSPIKTISGSLGINDKFLFIRELFNNDSELFNRTLEELDNSVNFNSAYTFLMDNFTWDMENDSVQMLLNLVRRKFISPGNE
jgi:hypothetical protein